MCSEFALLAQQAASSAGEGFVSLIPGILLVVAGFFLVVKLTQSYGVRAIPIIAAIGCILACLFVSIPRFDEWLKSEEGMEQLPAALLLAVATLSSVWLTQILLGKTKE